MKNYTPEWVYKRMISEIRKEYPSAENFSFEAGITEVWGSVTPYFDCLFNVGNSRLIAYWHDGALTIEPSIL